MVFSSITFLFLFLPVVLISYLCVGRHGRNLLLLASSLFFYLWGEQIFVLVMLFSIVINYSFGLLIDREQARGRHGKIYLTAAVVTNIGMLVIFKYADFLVENFNIALQFSGLNPLEMPEMHLPIGISFFTFQALSYVIDLYRKECSVQRNPLHLGLYISLFPQLIAGPIVRYHDIAGQINERRVRLEDFAKGCERFIFGLGKKVLIANPMGQLADYVFALSSAQLSTSSAWLGIICYTLQIYYDFSGYSDMAIGLGRMFGFTFPENFNYPYISRSIREFWRRWHISLSTWFRDYLYIPLGGNRKGSWRTSFNLLIVFLLCGFWHGASWNFIIWGLMYGVFLVLERGNFGAFLQSRSVVWQHGYTLLVVINGWVFFRTEQLADAVHYFMIMYGLDGADAMLPQIAMRLDLVFLCSFTAGIILSIPFYPWLQKQLSNRSGSRTAIALNIPLQTAKLLWTMAIFLYCAGSLAAGSYNPFIYFRF